jgi:catechol 2,3-dioxygenase-like lactoylglutathione lyase family enzyme
MDENATARPFVGMYSFRSPDPQRLARFWAEFMGLPIADGADHHLVMLDFDHVVSDKTWMFERAEEVGDGGMGLDISRPGTSCDDLAAHAEALGATRVANREQDGTEWVEMKDPDGNRFRLFNSFRVG